MVLASLAVCVAKPAASPISTNHQVEEFSALWETDLITGVMSNDHKMIKRAFNRMQWTHETHPGEVSNI